MIYYFLAKKFFSLTFSLATKIDLSRSSGIILPLSSDGEVGGGGGGGRDTHKTYTLNCKKLIFEVTTIITYRLSVLIIMTCSVPIPIKMAAFMFE